MARKQEVCGAISGGLLVIGLKHGRGEGQERTVTEKSYGKVRDLMARFESKHGSCLCRTLLNGCDLNTPEGHQYFKENDLLNKTCKGCVSDVVETLKEIL
jgi:C_GCAxxG_C_C family probable redox protein